MMLNLRIPQQTVLQVPPNGQLPAAGGNASVTPLFAAADGQPAARRRLRRPGLLSFLAIVALPVLVAAIYYFGIAADQYTAEFRLNLRTVDIPRVEPLIVLGSDMSHGGG
ncbi:MAG: hypothetical protein JO258_08500, partial [Alphaproteobacteria bacterium]|nr:hypothetical protein [Alphaproteobacteria bacterium]